VQKAGAFEAVVVGWRVLHFEQVIMQTGISPRIRVIYERHAPAAFITGSVSLGLSKGPGHFLSRVESARGDGEKRGWGGGRFLAGGVLRMSHYRLSARTIQVSIWKPRQG
jgi:hypothetical protein